MFLCAPSLLDIYRGDVYGILHDSKHTCGNKRLHLKIMIKSGSE